MKGCFSLIVIQVGVSFLVAMIHPPVLRQLVVTYIHLEIFEDFFTIILDGFTYHILCLLEQGVLFIKPV